MEQLARCLHHEDDYQMLRRVVPEGGARSAAPIIVARRSCVTCESGLAAHSESKTKPIAWSGRQACRSRADLAKLVRSHGGNRYGTQDALTVEFAPVLKHLQKLR